MTAEETPKHPERRREDQLVAEFRRWRRGAVIGFLFLLVAVVIGFIEIGNAADKATEAANEAKHAAATADAFSTTLRDGLIESCDSNGNPLRLAVIGVLQDQIDQSSNIKVLKTFFPDIAPSVLRAGVKDANKNRKEAIETLQPVDCDALYPLPSDKEN